MPMTVYRIDHDLFFNMIIRFYGISTPVQPYLILGYKIIDFALLITKLRFCVLQINEFFISYAFSPNYPNVSLPSFH